jgi:hypothetical protein
MIRFRSRPRGGQVDAATTLTQGGVDRRVGQDDVLRPGVEVVCRGAKVARRECDAGRIDKIVSVGDVADVATIADPAIDHRCTRFGCFARPAQAFVK